MFSGNIMPKQVRMRMFNGFENGSLCFLFLKVRKRVHRVLFFIHTTNLNHKLNFRIVIYQELGGEYYEVKDDIP